MIERGEQRRTTYGATRERRQNGERRGRPATVMYEKATDTVLRLSTAGDRSVGIWPAGITIIFPLSEKELKEDRDFAGFLKNELEAFFTHAMDEPVSGMWPWESDGPE